jgi:hypothetical protein
LQYTFFRVLLMFQGGSFYIKNQIDRLGVFAQAIDLVRALFFKLLLFNFCADIRSAFGMQVIACIA